MKTQLKKAFYRTNGKVNSAYGYCYFTQEQNLILYTGHTPPQHFGLIINSVPAFWWDLAADFDF